MKSIFQGAVIRGEKCYSFAKYRTYCFLFIHPHSDYKIHGSDLFSPRNESEIDQLTNSRQIWINFQYRNSFFSSIKHHKSEGYEL
jgi:hypothetical protein